MVTATGPRMTWTASRRPVQRRGSAEAAAVAPQTIAPTDAYRRTNIGFTARTAER